MISPELASVLASASVLSENTDVIDQATARSNPLTPSRPFTDIGFLAALHPRAETSRIPKVNLTPSHLMEDSQTMLLQDLDFVMHPITPSLPAKMLRCPNLICLT